MDFFSFKWTRVNHQEDTSPIPTDFLSYSFFFILTNIFSFFFFFFFYLSVTCIFSFWYVFLFLNVSLPLNLTFSKDTFSHPYQKKYILDFPSFFRLANLQMKLYFSIMFMTWTLSLPIDICKHLPSTPLNHLLWYCRHDCVGIDFCFDTPTMH